MMGYISRYDRTFLAFVKKKYKDYQVEFGFWDDYALWLYEICLRNDKAYYKQLEKDLWQYVEFQSGKERDKRGKLDDNWEKD